MQALPEHLNTQCRGETERMHFRKLYSQIIIEKSHFERGGSECGSLSERESFICAAKRWLREMKWQQRKADHRGREGGGQGEGRRTYWDM